MVGRDGESIGAAGRAFRVSFAPGANTAVVREFVALIRAGADHPLVSELAGLPDGCGEAAVSAVVERHLDSVPDVALAMPSPSGWMFTRHGGIVTTVVSSDASETSVHDRLSVGTHRAPMRCDMHLDGLTLPSATLHWIERGVVPAEAIVIDMVDVYRAPAQVMPAVPTPGFAPPSRAAADSATVIRPERSVAPARADDATEVRAQPGRTAGATDATVVRTASVAPAVSTALAAGFVHAVSCPSGHASPPTALRCRMCDAPIGDRSVHSIRRPVLGTLHAVDGRSWDVAGPVVIGRQPPDAVELDGEAAEIVTIEDGRLSRVHAVLYVVDWFVQVVDQQSLNGTVLHVPGQPPQRLRPLERVTAPIGTRITLGDAFEMTFDGSGR